MTRRNVDSLLISLAEEAGYKVYANFCVSNLAKDDRYALKSKLDALAREIGYEPLFVERRGRLIVFAK
jgi:flavin-dependent dehydrogenase